MSYGFPGNCYLDIIGNAPRSIVSLNSWICLAPPESRKIPSSFKPILDNKRNFTEISDTSLLYIMYTQTYNIWHIWINRS